MSNIQVLKEDLEILEALKAVKGVVYYLVCNNQNTKELLVVDNFNVYNLPKTTVQPTKYDPSGNANNNRILRKIPGYGVMVFVPKSEIEKLKISTIAVHPWHEKLDVGASAIAGLLA